MPHSGQGVLVLNSLYQAVQVTGVHRAFRLFYAGRARAVTPELESYNFEDRCDLPPRAGDVTIRTPTRTIRIPTVIQLIHYARLPNCEVRFNRRNIFIRDRNRCQYCGKTAPPQQLSIDHVMPRSRGGPTTWENVVCCCLDCNTRKGGRTPKEARMKLLRRPVKPRLNPLLARKLVNPKYEIWKTFLDASGTLEVA